MQRRHKKPPKIWLMTDPRLGEKLRGAVQGLRAGSGVIFRHYDSDEKDRRALFKQLRRICARRGHSLFLAGDERRARQWGADGFHNRTAKRSSSPLTRSAAVHNICELAEAKRVRADYLFISPIYRTHSHPGARALGASAFRQLAQQCGAARVIALGGMNAARGAMQDGRVVHGWAAIDAFGKQ
jgi:thiamine-phosphate pyrophosphorylase